MRARLITAGFMSVIVLLALGSSSHWLYFSLLALIFLAASWEWSGFLHLTAVPARVAYVLAVWLLAWAGFRYAWDAASFTTLMLVAAAWWLLAFAWVLSAPARVPAWAAAIAGVLTLVPAILALLRFTVWPLGMGWSFFVLLVPVAMDTGGFFAGRSFGRLKLAPRISPGKTWEGVFGGVLLVLLVSAAASYWLPVPRITFFCLCLAAAVYAVVGDLTESLLKRASGLKDSGRLFPGHGGVLDRIDSITAVAPLMALGLQQMGVGP
jgi:phosphatidate cytidylyltransferase